MSQATHLRGDGSSVHDRRPTVTISTKGHEKWRYRCPQGHCNWDRTNNHGWCPECAAAAAQGVDVDPEFWFVVDQKTGEEIAWERLEFEQ